MTEQKATTPTRAVTGYAGAAFDWQTPEGRNIRRICRYLATQDTSATADQITEALTGEEFGAAEFFGTPTPELVTIVCRALIGEHRVIETSDGRYQLRPELIRATITGKWQWAGDIIPGYKRKREQLAVAHAAAGWPLEGNAAGWPGHQICCSIFSRSANNRCTDLPVWQVKQITGRRVGISYWCDSELPAKYRPATA